MIILERKKKKKKKRGKEKRGIIEAPFLDSLTL